MSDMYKIVRYTPGSINEERENDLGIRLNPVHGAKWYHGFEKAKKAMRETVKEKFDSMDVHCAELIDSYCAKYYPDGAPENFALLKEFIKDAIYNPEALEENLEEKYEEIDFEDERVCFALEYDFDNDGAIRHLYIDVSEDAKWTFPEGIISSIYLQELTDPESERYISLTAGKNWGLEIVFSLMTDEDEENFIFEN